MHETLARSLSGTTVNILQIQIVLCMYIYIVLSDRNPRKLAIATQYDGQFTRTPDILPCKNTNLVDSLIRTSTYGTYIHASPYSKASAEHTPYFQPHLPEIFPSLVLSWFSHNYLSLLSQEVCSPLLLVIFSRHRTWSAGQRGDETSTRLGTL